MALVQGGGGGGGSKGSNAARYNSSSRTNTAAKQATSKKGVDAGTRLRTTSNINRQRAKAKSTYGLGATKAYAKDVTDASVDESTGKARNDYLKDYANASSAEVAEPDSASVMQAVEDHDNDEKVAFDSAKAYGDWSTNEEYGNSGVSQGEFQFGHGDYYDTGLDDIDYSSSTWRDEVQALIDAGRLDKWMGDWEKWVYSDEAAGQYADLLDAYDGNFREWFLDMLLGNEERGVTARTLENIMSDPELLLASGDSADALGNMFTYAFRDQEGYDDEGNEAYFYDMPEVMGNYQDEVIGYYDQMTPEERSDTVLAMAVQAAVNDLITESSDSYYGEEGAPETLGENELAILEANEDNPLYQYITGNFTLDDLNDLLGVGSAEFGYGDGYTTGDMADYDLGNYAGMNINSDQYVQSMDDQATMGGYYGIGSGYGGTRSGMTWLLNQIYGDEAGDAGWKLRDDYSSIWSTSGTEEAA